MSNLFQELEASLVIDENALDEALATQADCFYRVAKQVALQTSRRDAAKQALAEAEARADAKIRHDAEVADEKITDKNVEKQRQLTKEVVAATNLLHSLNKSVGLWIALKESFQQRNYALKSMADLYVAGYFGGQTSSSSATHIKNSAGQEAKELMRRERKRVK